MKKVFIDGKDQILYQWDTGQRLILEGFEPGIRVDFGRCHDGDAPSNYAYEEDGKIYVDIPDATLQHSVQLVAYFVAELKDRSETVFSWPLTVFHRPKPADHVEPEQIKTWSALEERITALEKGGTGLNVKAEIKDGVLVVNETSGAVTARIEDDVLICEMEE